MKQPEALRLADALEDDLADYGGQSLPRCAQDIADDAAAELRRLHAEVQDWDRVCDQHLRHIDKLKKRMKQAEAVNQELLVALKLAVRQNEHDMLMTGEELRIASAAIAKAEEA